MYEYKYSVWLYIWAVTVYICDLQLKYIVTHCIHRYTLYTGVTSHENESCPICDMYFSVMLYVTCFMSCESPTMWVMSRENIWVMSHATWVMSHVTCIYCHVVFHMCYVTCGSHTTCMSHVTRKRVMAHMWRALSFMLYVTCVMSLVGLTLHVWVTSHVIESWPICDVHLVSCCMSHVLCHLWVSHYMYESRHT